MGGTVSAAVDRRQADRRPRSAFPWITSVRLRPGHDVRLIELSADSALVETSVSLAPDRVVVLELRVRKQLVEARGRVVRGYVAGIDAGGEVRYRGIVSFDPGPGFWCVP